GGADWQTIMYEGYGPSGVAMLIECLTDNRNRAATDVRTALTRNGGTFADAGSVSYLFNRKGVVIVPKGQLTEDDIMLAVLDAGAEDINDLGDSFEVISEPNDLIAVRTALQDAGIEYDSAESSLVPTMTVPIDEDAARKVFKLIDALEDLDDVQNVYGNCDVPDGVMAPLGASRASGGAPGSGDAELVALRVGEYGPLAAGFLDVADQRRAVLLQPGHGRLPLTLIGVDVDVKPGLA